MNRVQFNRKWEINSRQDYDEAMRILDGNDYIAEMSDCFHYWQSEKAEVASQRADVIRQAKVKGFLSEVIA